MFDLHDIVWHNNLKGDIMNYFVIKELFDLNCDKIKESEKYALLAKQADLIINKIAESKTEAERRELLSKLNCLQGEMETEVSAESFTEGFKIGFALALETVSGLNKD